MTNPDLSVPHGYRLHPGTDLLALAERLRTALAPVRDRIEIAQVAEFAAKALDEADLAGTPRPESVIFDAVAVVLSDASAKKLAKEGAAVDFVHDAFGHLKAIAADEGAGALLDAAGVIPDEGVLDTADPKAFITAAKTRQWAREPKVRTLP